MSRLPSRKRRLRPTCTQSKPKTSPMRNIRHAFSCVQYRSLLRQNRWNLGGCSCHGTQAARLRCLHLRLTACGVLLKALPITFVGMPSSFILRSACTSTSIQGIIEGLYVPSALQRPIHLFETEASVRPNAVAMVLVEAPCSFIFRRLISSVSVQGGMHALSMVLFISVSMARTLALSSSS